MKEIIEKLEKAKNVLKYQSSIDALEGLNGISQAIQALQQNKTITKEEIEYRIKEEFKKHKELDWAKIAAGKIYALLPSNQE